MLRTPPRRPTESLNWRALQRFPRLLVRRTADRDEWIIAVGKDQGRAVTDQPSEAIGAVGHIGFNYPRGTDRIHVRPRAASGFAPSAWWEPDVMLRWGPSGLAVVAEQPEANGLAHELIAALRRPSPPSSGPSDVEWTRRTPKDRYLDSVEKLLRHIQRGDIYEVNYCTERTATLPGWDPFEAFGRLVRHTEAPFATLYRQGPLFALCMSPERFLRIEGRQVLTQPMKGTRRRAEDPGQDQLLARELANDAKERSENIMAVDVARHDLSRVAASRSVRVDELCAVKTYPNVHQLVSTVTARLREGLGPWDAVRAAFPMASMTGAPKLRALELIDAVEDMPRGLFSGSLGYQLPDGTLDLNVVIRTITYDVSTGLASLITGSAITAQSDPEREWEECELKARSVLDALI